MYGNLAEQAIHYQGDLEKAEELTRKMYDMAVAINYPLVIGETPPIFCRHCSSAWR